MLLSLKVYLTFLSSPPSSLSQPTEIRKANTIFSFQQFLHPKYQNISLLQHPQQYQNLVLVADRDPRRVATHDNDSSFPVCTFTLPQKVLSLKFNQVCTVLKTCLLDLYISFPTSSTSLQCSQNRTSILRVVFDQCRQQTICRMLATLSASLFFVHVCPHFSSMQVGFSFDQRARIFVRYSQFAKTVSLTRYNVINFVWVHCK